MKSFIVLLALIAIAFAQYGSSYGSSYGTNSQYGYGSSSGMYTDPMTGRQYTQQQVSSALQMCGSSSSYGNNQMYNPSSGYSSGSYYPSSSTYSYGKK